MDGIKDNNKDNIPKSLNKVDEIVYSRGRTNFTDTRNKVMKVDRKNFIWNTKFDTRRMNWDVEKDPLKKGFSYFSIGLFTFSLVLLFGSVFYAYYAFVTGGSSVRQDKIDLALEIPTFTSAGIDMQGQIIIGNENKIAFKEAFVSLDTQEEDGTKKNINQIQIGDVLSGDKIYKNITLNLSGLEGDKKIVSATLYYKVPQTESVFEKTITQDVLISRSPIVMSISGPNTLSVGQDGEYIIKIRGVSKVIPALLLNIDLPKQMRVIKTSVPEVSKNIYSLGPINEGDLKTFKWTGSFKDTPEIGEKFTIKVRAGQGEENEVKSYFAENTYGINLFSSPIKITVESEGQKGDKISFGGKQPKVKVTVLNTGNQNVKLSTIEFKFSGGLLKPKSVVVDGAQYDASKFTARADGNTNDALKEITPNQKVEFLIEFTELESVGDVSGRNLFINTTYTFNTEDSQGEASIQRLTTTLTPKESTNANLQTLFFSGAFKNDGPMPPVVGQKTTYTINLNTQTNSGFTVGKFILPLPPYVEYVKSLDNTVGYSKEQNTVTWNVGNLSKSTTTAFGISQKSTSIQVSIIPTPDQVRTAPALSKAAHFEATLPDKSQITLPIADTSVNFSTDPQYEIGKGYESVGE